MRLPFISIPRDDVVRGLRLNVGDLQKRLDRTKRYLANVTAANERRKKQIRADQLYIDQVKTCSWLVVSLAQQHRHIPRDLFDAADELRKALEGRR